MFNSPIDLRWLTPLIFGVWGVVLFSNSFADLWRQWQTAEYGHGMLLPFISIAWAVWLLQKREVDFRASYIGPVVLTAALMLNSLGLLISNHWLSNLALVVFIIGMVSSFLGMKAVRRTLPALFLLFFAVPLPVTILPVLTADLQLISSAMGVTLLKLMDVPVYLEGNIIDLGNHKLDVAIACSGLQYLFPLMSLSYLIALLSFEVWWKRGVMFLAALPITLGMNATRIAVSGLIYHWYGTAALEEVLHYIEGYVVFGLCLVILLGLKFLLNRAPPRKDAAVDSEFSLEKILFYNITPASKIHLILLLSIFLSVTFFPAYLTKQQGTEITLVRQTFFNFPLAIGHWTGTRSTLSHAELQTLNLTDYFVGDFTYPHHDFTQMNLYIAYYNKQTQENSIHSPQICLPASGWVTLSHDMHQIDALTVNKEIIQRNGQKMLVYYWFREAGYEAASKFDVKRLLLLNALRNGRTDGGLIRLTAPLRPGDSVHQVQEQMDDFVRHLRPQLPTYLPPPSRSAM